MERRLHKAEVRISPDSGKIIGTAAVVYRKNDVGTEYSHESYGMPGAVERIMPGAFDDVLNQDIYAATNHDPSLIFSRVSAGSLKVWADDSGLHYAAQPADTTAGRDALANAKAGNFGGSSFAFTVSPDGERWTNDGDKKVREITKLDSLVDVSPVTSPAYKSTTVDARASARASYGNWLQQIGQDIQDLQKLRDTLDKVLKAAEEDEEEVPEAVDGECPDGWSYDEESGTCVMAEEPTDDEEEAYQRARAIFFTALTQRHVQSWTEDEETITVVYAKEPTEEPVDEVPTDDDEADRLRRAVLAVLEADIDV